MNIIEFINRTGVTVTTEEYATIEANYMACDLDKDAFCRAWCRVNRARVNAAKVAAKRAAVIDRIQSAIMRNAIWHGYIAIERIAVNVLSDAIIADIESLGIDMQAEPNSDGFRHWKSLADIKDEIMAIAA